MADTNDRDPMLDVFIFEANQLIDQLEEIMLETEKNGGLSVDSINEIFRIMHTIKGSSAMMAFNNISKLAHSVEDLFYFIRENKPQGLDISTICDLVLPASDFIKQEVAKINEGGAADGDETNMEAQIKAYLAQISGKPAEKPAARPAAAGNSPEKTAEPVPEDGGAGRDPTGETEAAPSEAEVASGQKYMAVLRFEEGGQMENLRAYTIQRNLMEYATEITTDPADVINTPSEKILENGFTLYFATDRDESQIKALFEEALFLKSYELTSVDSFDEEPCGGKSPQASATSPAVAPATGEQTPKASARPSAVPAPKPAGGGAKDSPRSTKLSLISVDVTKLDTLMNLVGEIVISESMVTKNPDLENLQLDRFGKAARQLRKLTDELQDIVMSIRMVQIAGTFQKMQRIVRDMSRKLGKDVEFVTEGDSTEVDKNIIDHLSDPLMHLIRNSMDHGVEPEEERLKAGKAKKARITLTAQNTGGDVMITVSDDGRGLDKAKILKKARENGMLTKPEKNMTDKEIYQLIMMPGFSTNDVVTEYSGRGVGMDVVRQNIEEVGGSVSIKSVEGKGTTITIVIPLTLAIADAMELSVGDCVFTMPITAIRESFRPKDNEIIYDNMNNEMIMIRGNVYPIIRLHRIFNIESKVTKLSDGILIMIEGDNKAACIFADQLIGEQQVVVKPLPQYLVRYQIKDNGIEGCTILGNGNISLILNAKGLISRMIQ